MQFREHKHLIPVVLYDSVPEKLAMKVARLGKEFNLIDLQYSSHSITSEVGYAERFSVFALVQVPEHLISQAKEAANKETKKEN